MISDEVLEHLDQRFAEADAFERKQIVARLYATAKELDGFGGVAASEARWCRDRAGVFEGGGDDDRSGG